MYEIAGHPARVWCLQDLRSEYSSCFLLVTDRVVHREVILPEGLGVEEQEKPKVIGAPSTTYSSDRG